MNILPINEVVTAGAAGVVTAGAAGVVTTGGAGVVKVVGIAAERQNLFSNL
jgi:hypothetical protein